MNIKKLLAGTTAITMVATQAMTGLTTVSAASVNPEWVEAVNFMKTEGLSSVANSVEQYMPLATVKREAAAKFFDAFAEKEFNRVADTTKVCAFSDINEANPVFVPYIKKACQLGIINGVDGKALPKATLTKLQFITMLARVVKNNSRLTPAEAFNILKADGITNEATLANTQKPVSRIEVAILFKRAVAKYATTQQENNNADNNAGNIADVISSVLGGDDNNNQTTTGNTNTDNNQDNNQTTTGNDNNQTAPAGEDKLVVALDPATPAEQYVPGTGSHIQVLKFDLTAGSKDVTVTAANIKLSGMVNKDNVTKVYVEDANGVVLTNQRGFNTDYEARLVFNGGYTVKAGEKKALYLVMDVKNSTNELIKLSITDIEASSTVEGTPIISNVVHTTAYSSTVVSFDAYTNTEITNPSNKLYVGDKDKEIMKFTLANGGQNNKDVILKSLRFRGVQTLEGKIENVKLVQGSTTVDADVVVDGKYVTFNVKDYKLKDGDSKTFYVHADIVGGEKNDRIQLYLDETSDISAIEEGTNAATSVTATANKYGKAYKIEEGDNLITKSSTSPSSAYVPNDEDDITALIANVNTSAEMYVEKVRVYRTGTATGADIKKVKLYINDKYVDEATTTGNDGQDYYEFSYYGNLKGANKFVVTFDTEKNANDGATIAFEIKNTSIAFGSNAEYVASKNTVDSSEIKGSAAGSTMTIKKPALISVTKTDGFAMNGEKLIAGAQDVLVAKYTFQANNVRDLKITDIPVTLTGDIDNISTLKLAVNGQVVDTQNVDSTSVTFDSLSVNVPRGGTAEVSVLATLTTSYDTGKNFQVTLTTPTVEDAKGNTVNVPAISVAGSNFTVVAGATLATTLNSNSPVEQVVAANPNVEVEVARFDFKPTDDDAQIQELLLQNVEGTGADSLVSAVYVYDANGNKLGTANLADGYVDFNFANNVNLPKDQTTTLVVKVKTNAINSVELTNNAIKFAVVATGTGTQKTKVISKSNGSEIALTGTLATANKIIVRKTLLTFANDAQTTTTLNAGTNDAYLFNVTADAAGAAKVKAFKFDVNLSSASATIDGYEFYINGARVNSGDVEYTTGTNSVEVTFTGANYENGYEVSAGSTVHFKLVANIGGTVATNDSLTVRLNNNGTDTSIGTGGQFSTYSVIWSDEAAKGTVTGGTADWFTDAKLLSLPLNSQTLTK